jgi:hypothetical protein
METLQNQQAFPVLESDGNGNLILSDPGMTLLDYFAAKAMPYMMGHIDCKNKPDFVAHHAYRYAAAMLEERKNYIVDPSKAHLA